MPNICIVTKESVWLETRSVLEQTADRCDQLREHWGQEMCLIGGAEERLVPDERLFIYDPRKSAC